MSKVVVLGAGQIGTSVADLLAESGDYDVTLGDASEGALAGARWAGVEKCRLDVADDAALGAVLEGAEIVVNTLPYFFVERVALAAKAAGAHYFDPTEDIDQSVKVRALAEGAETAFIPQCGLAPGFIAIVANALVARMDEPHDVRLRVGALPQFPDNALKYNRTWSIDGLINEYCNVCDAIHEGERRELLPLEGLETISLDGIDYEAFSTSGGVGTLCEALEGKVRNLSYKTLRYPGHRAMIEMLVRDLGLCQHRDVFKKLLEEGIPTTRQDVVLIFVTVTGVVNGNLTQESYARKIYSDPARDGRSAIQLTTASGIAAMVDLHRDGKLPQSGFVSQEQAPFADFIANRFGKIYA